MDVWRYSDWWGLGAGDAQQPEAHLALARLDRRIAQRDKGYDRMVREMLAADELCSERRCDRSRRPAFSPAIISSSTARPGSMRTIEHTAKAFLGLTINCAKCHDHKYDPISAGRLLPLPRVLRAVSDSARPGARRDGLREGRHAARVRLRTWSGRLSAHPRRRRNGRTRAARFGLGCRSCSRRRALTIEPVALPAEAFQPGLRPFVLADHIRAAEKQRSGAKASATVDLQIAALESGSRRRTSRGTQRKPRDARGEGTGPAGDACRRSGWRWPRRRRHWRRTARLSRSR